MSIVKFSCLVSIFLLGTRLAEIFGHGILMDPVNRSSAWRKGFKNPVNTDDMALYCGGVQQDMERQKGNDITCGVCGDSYDLARPRPNENRGEFGNGIIVRTYKRGERIKINVTLTATHKGNFDFSLCPLDRPEDIENEGCFNKYPLRGRMITPYSGTESYFFGPANVTGRYIIELQLPTELSCKHCSFRWQYVAASSVEFCVDGTERPGCGPQEVFRNCADISIQ